MINHRFFVWIAGLSVCSFTCYNGLAQSLSPLKETPSEQWQAHPHSTQAKPHSTTSLPRYHKKPGLYPSKHRTNNPLRKKGWHTHPDPYIEEGGVYTNKPHPALTDNHATMREYTSGTPNQYVSPPATVLGSTRTRQSQQKVQIRDPLPGKVPPINLPPS